MTGRKKSCGCLLKNPPNKESDRILSIQKRYFISLKQSAKKRNIDMGLNLEKFIKIENETI